jgi:hypothetical protein
MATPSVAGTSSSGPFSQIGTTAAGITSYTDSATTDGTTYYYVVRGQSGLGGTGLDSNVASAKADATRPTVSSTDPVDQTTTEMLTPSVLVTFSEPMEQAITAANFALVPCQDWTCGTPGAAIAGVLAWQSSTGLHFVPTVTLNGARGTASSSLAARAVRRTWPATP